MFSGLVAPQAQAEDPAPKKEQTQSSNPLEGQSSSKDDKKGDDDKQSSNPLESLSSDKDDKKGDDQQKQVLIALGVLAAVLGGIFAVTQLPQVRELLPAQIADLLP